jgi:hypothetical protein
MTREEIIAAIQTCARKLGRTPTRAELKKMAGVSVSRVKYVFRGMTFALREAGLDPTGRGHLIPTAELLLQWARVVRKLGKLPAMARYQSVGKSTHVPFIRRYGSWHAVPGAFRKMAREKQIEKEWEDVLTIIGAAHEVELRKKIACPGRMRGKSLSAISDEMSLTEPETWNPRANEYSRRKLLPGRALAGPPMDFAGLAHEPANELGVVFFFGTQAHALGFHVLTFQQEFPDCEAMREVRPGKWQRVRIEFEFESRNFQRHGHQHDGCDVIVCWRHNWAECPKSIEVVELRKVVGR